ncbi:c-type cytochrome [Flavihumibacter profundi]|jgi:hypothetical protein|uniref:c-type cytochrome n=1 Tax=Flavihumibacter profundi TaxID=2716883 RepID=UPI001CC60131|nr:hypothetical protein [Flavihumibacter profundi]MBZ5856773.1 hypothetical protein [Flavihumibacter profundi]
MQKKLKIAIFLTASVGAFFSCTKDNAASQNANTSCNTENMSFSKDIQPIVSANCTASCHNAANPTGNRIFTSYSGVANAVDNGKLIGVISHSPGYTPMPQGGAKLSDCNISKIKAWVDQGALDN